MRAVNLLPEDTNASRFGKPGTVPIAGTAAALLAIGAVAALAHVESGSVSDKQARLNDLQQQLSQVQKPAATAGKAGAVLLTSRDGRIAALNSALTGRVPWETVLHQLAAVLPDDTWFDSLAMNSPTAAVAGAAPVRSRHPDDERRHADRVHGVAGVARTRPPAPRRRPVSL